MHEYGAEFYSFLNSFAVRSAQSIVPVVHRAVHPASVVDFGCGCGAWLSVWQTMGANILGADGPYIDRSSLLIPSEAFFPTDLAAPADLGRRFDLAQSLEVAEHLPLSSAQEFVRTLVRHADYVLFSAAVPGQGGEHHINEQKLEFWRALFSAEGYAPVDIVRPAVMGNKDIQIWYRCNTILYTNKPGLERLPHFARAHVIRDDSPIPNFWPAHHRLLHRCLRTIPPFLTDYLAQTKAALRAREAQAK